MTPSKSSSKEKNRRLSVSRTGGSSEDLLKRLKKTLLFKDVADKALLEIIAETEVFTTYTGQTLMEEGDEAGDLFLVLSGRVSLLVQSINPPMEVPLTKLGPGEVIGEMALFKGQRRYATIVAQEQCRLVRIPGTFLREFAETKTETGLLLMRNCAELIGLRLRTTNQRLVNVIRSHNFR